MLRSLLFAAVFASLLINCYEARTIRLANSFLCAKSGLSVEEGLTQHEKSIQIKGEEISNTQTDSVPILLLTEKAGFKVVFHTNSKECKEQFKIKEDSKGCKKQSTIDGHNDFPKPPHCGESCTGYEVVCTGVKLASVEEQEIGGIVGLKRSELARMFGGAKCEWEAVIMQARLLVSDLKDLRKGESCGKKEDTKQPNVPVWAWVLIAVGGVLILLCIIGIAVSCIIVGVGAKKEGRQQYETRQTGSRSLWNRAAGSISRVQQRFVVIRARPRKATAASPGGGGNAFGGGASGFGGRGGGMTTGMGRPPSAYADNITKKGAPSSKYGFV